MEERRGEMKERGGETMLYWLVGQTLVVDFLLEWNVSVNARCYCDVWFDRCWFVSG